MPELEEVFRMATQKVRPDPGALERQNREQRRRTNRRKVGVYALVACLAIATVLIAVDALRHEHNGIANKSTVSPVAPLFFTVDLRSGTTTPFPIPGPYAEGFDVSPDGTRIAYADRDSTGTDQIFVMDSDGSHPTQLTRNENGAAPTAEPAWSTDGSQIAYTGLAPDLSPEIFVVDVATGRSTRLTTTTKDRPAANPTWDPEGKVIAFGDGTNFTASRVHTVDVATHATTTILNDAGVPAWSPDGRLIAFNTWSVAHVTLANRDGSARREISHTDSCCAEWSPNGSRIAYNKPYNGEGGVYVYDVATGETRRAAATGFIESWVDDHTLLIAKFPSY